MRGVEERHETKDDISKNTILLMVYRNTSLKPSINDTIKAVLDKTQDLSIGINNWECEKKKKKKDIKDHDKNLRQIKEDQNHG